MFVKCFACSLNYNVFLLSVVPKVELSLGRMVNPEDLEEGDDIYFSCSIKANPPAYKITWWHNVRENIARSVNYVLCIWGDLHIKRSQFTLNW